MREHCVIGGRVQEFGDQVAELLAFELAKTACRDRRAADANTRGDERFLGIVRNRVLVDGDVGMGERRFGARCWRLSRFGAASGPTHAPRTDFSARGIAGRGLRPRPPATSLGEEFDHLRASLDVAPACQSDFADQRWLGLCRFLPLRLGGLLNNLRIWLFEHLSKNPDRYLLGPHLYVTSEVFHATAPR